MLYRGGTLGVQAAAINFLRRSTCLWRAPSQAPSSSSPTATTMRTRRRCPARPGTGHTLNKIKALAR